MPVEDILADEYDALELEIEELVEQKLLDRKHKAWEEHVQNAHVLTQEESEYMFMNDVGYLEPDSGARALAHMQNARKQRQYGPYGSIVDPRARDAALDQILKELDERAPLHKDRCPSCQCLTCSRDGSCY